MESNTEELWIMRERAQWCSESTLSLNIKQTKTQFCSEAHTVLLLFPSHGAALGRSRPCPGPAKPSGSHLLPCSHRQQGCHGASQGANAAYIIGHFYIAQLSTWDLKCQILLKEEPAQRQLVQPDHHYIHHHHLLTTVSNWRQTNPWSPWNKLFIFPPYFPSVQN